jgi:alkaline phosphatase D
MMQVLDLFRYIFLLCFGILFVFSCQQDPTEEIGEFAPPDAYLEGSTHPYYGSENEWNRRFFSSHIRDYYKRRGQRQMLDIVEGRTRQAAIYCGDLLMEDASDLESLFNLAVARAHLGNLTEAMQTLTYAVNSGLPFSRFLAGPRDVLKPLTESDEFKNYANKKPIQLIHGPMLGCLTDTSARFWVRTLDEVEVQVVLSSVSNAFQPKISNIQKTKSENDYTAIVEVTGLVPSTTYFYDVFLNGKATLKTKMPTFQTLPSHHQAAKFQVGFGGGAGYIPANERMWDVILTHRLHAFLFMGDNVYINMPQEPNGVHYYTYYRRQSRPEFRRLVASTAIYAIWDDHDCATDDVWMGPFKDRPSWKLPLFNIFRQNWNNPGYGDSEWPGCWFRFSIADVDFFMLDGRFYRTNPYDENPTMLGPVQKAWLLDQLATSDATFKVIASPVPWSLATKGGARDTWFGFQQERKEIFDFLAINRIEGVILLSADRHRSDAWRIDRPNGYPLYEFESSRLTNQHVHDTMPGSLFGYNEKQSFGVLTFDTTVPDPTATYQIFSIDDELIQTIMIRKSQVSHE